MLAALGTDKGAPGAHSSQNLSMSKDWRAFGKILHFNAARQGRFKEG